MCISDQREITKNLMIFFSFFLSLLLFSSMIVIEVSLDVIIKI